MGKALLDVLRARKPERRPVWLMRQAGRYLPEYRDVREKAGSFLNLCYNPELAAEVTLQPLRRYDFDAAIVFSDILVVPHAMGASLDFIEQEGPVLSVTSDDGSVAGLRSSGPYWQFERVYETLARVKAGLQDSQTLIGFCGAPWTVASYMVEGRGSDRKKALRAAAEGPIWFEQLVEKIIAVSIDYLVGQVRAGAEVVQIFDSWAGDLPSGLRERWVAQPIRRIVDGLRAVYPGFPVIVFGRGIATDHANLALATAASAVGVEQGLDLAQVFKSLPGDTAVQGNLAPELLLGAAPSLETGIADICGSVAPERHIFNLGHGILQQTPPENVTRLLSAIRRFDRRAT